MLSILCIVARAVAASPTTAQVTALEAEHLSLLAPTTTASGLGAWQPPVLDSDSQMFSWRVAVSSANPARNVTQVSAQLTLTADGKPPIVCRPKIATGISLFCGSAADWTSYSARYVAQLDVVLTAYTSASEDPISLQATAKGAFIRGLQPSTDGWGGAEWIGLSDVNDTAVQYRTETDISSQGFQSADDVAQATLFVSGLGGYRATINGRPLDPTSVRGSVTEWSNRTLYFGDEVTADIRLAASAGGRVAIALEVYKHWYGLSNKFYTIPYGPRALKAVLSLTHANGTNVLIAPTCSSSSSGDCSWRHSSGSTLHEDLHLGQSADGRLAKPGWESPKYDATGWAVPAAVKAPSSALRAHPMPRSRVLELVRPLNNVKRIVGDQYSGPGETYRFELPYEIAGFCTLVLPRSCPAGAYVKLRHGEAVDMGTGYLVETECTKSVSAPGRPHQGCENTSYICAGNAAGMGAHDQSWRRLAIGGNTSGLDDPDLEAFTPAFQFSAFRYIEVSYDNSSSAASRGWFKSPDSSSLACYRVGAGFDWTGDVTVAAPAGTAQENIAETGEQESTTAAERFNAVFAATRSTAIANYLMDIPTDCPHREKRGWTGDSLAAHTALGSFFDMRAAWTKWIDDILYQQSVSSPAGTTPSIAPCIFSTGFACKNDPRAGKAKFGSGEKESKSFADVAWGSVLPIVGAYTAALTGDSRFAVRAAQGAGAYVELLHSYANNASDPERSRLPGLLNYSSWPATVHGDWCPANGSAAVSTLLNTHHMILDIDAAISLIRLSGNTAHDVVWGDTPSEVQLSRWVSTARDSFFKGYLRNISLPGPSNDYATCGSVKEKESLDLTCGAGGGVIDQVIFAGYGIPEGTCPSGGFRPSAECFLNVSTQVAAACVGKSQCSVECYAEPPDLRICAGANVSDPCSGVQKHLSVSVQCSTPPGPKPPAAGLAFHDPNPPPGNRIVQQQTEAAAGLAVMDAVLTNDTNLREELASTLGALVTDVSPNQTATVTGGIIDMSHLASDLMLFGRPDVAFGVLSADGFPSYYNMAKYGGTLWESWDNANGCDTPAGCAKKHGFSLNHIMHGGSVSQAVFGIGGVQPLMPDSSSSAPASAPLRLRIAPVPWIPDAPRGAAVWRSRAGVASSAWAASESARTKAAWQLWVNATVPANSGRTAEIRVMLPTSASKDSVCVWECGLSSGAGSFVESDWVSFDVSGGHREYRAVAPAASAVSPPTDTGDCTLVWRPGAVPLKATPLGVESASWLPAEPGRRMFPALSLEATSGSYSFFALPASSSVGAHGNGSC